MQDEAGTCGWRMRDCPNVTGFTDVATSNEFSDAIFYVKSLGIVQGYADGTFKPDATINRAEFTKMLVGNVSDQLENECIAPRISDALTFGFSDVFANDWFARYICVAQQDGIIAGYPDGSFSPSGDVNFAEAAKMLGISVDTHDFTIPPSEENEPWYGRFVRYLESRSAIPMSIVSFDQKITRGEMAEMIYRLRMGGDKQTRTYDELSRGVGETMFTVHFYTQHDVKNASGEANIAVVRRVPYSSNVADTALKALFAGPTAKEYAAGARTTDDLSSLGAEYRGVAIHATYPDPYGGSMLQNVAIVDFGAKAFTILNGAAVRQGMAKAAIEATLKQFPTIQNVLYTKDGELFVEWDA
jgi:hypothetical protein